MAQPAPRPGSALFERLFGRPPEAESEEAKLRTLFELLGATLDTRGGDYLSALAAHLTDLLRIDLCLITQVDEVQSDWVTVLAQGKRGKVGSPGMRYELKGTPCEMVMQGVEYYVADGVAEAFPLDTMLVEHGFRSYFGFPLWGDNDEVIGKICLLDVEAMPDPELAREVVGMFTQRVSAELVRARAREEARVADETLHRFVQDFPGWVCAYESAIGGEHRRILFSSEKGADLVGSRNLAMLMEDATRYNTLLHPEERERVEAVYEEARRSNGNYDLEYRMRQDDGRYRWVQATGCFNTLEDGRCMGHSVMLDRDSYRRLEKRHEALLHEMHTLVGAIPDAVILQDGTGRVRFLNAAAEKLTGLKAKSLMGKDFATLADQHPEFSEIFQNAHTNTHAAFAAKKRVDSRVSRTLPHNAEERSFETVRIPILDEDGSPTALVTILRDVTERETARAQAEELRVLESRAARLAALSRLVDGVTHEFENQLTAVLGYSDLGEARVRQFAGEKEAEVLGRSFHRIREAAQNASELTRNLQAFGNSRGEGGMRCAPAQVISRKAASWKTRFGESRKLLIESDGADLDLECIALSPSGFVDMMERLLSNAYEATSVDGSITVRLARTTDEGGDDRGMEVSVMDDGSGVPQHLCERVFDPLFSTHEDTSRRRGMGLAVVHNLALCAGGSIRLANSGDSGSTFIAQFPSVPVEQCAAELHDSEAPTILLVDDQEGTRELMEEVLSAAGYRVTTCCSCAETRALAANLPDPDLILIDVFLEDGIGTELVAELSHRWPGVRALFCSGMPADHLEQQGVRLPSGNPLLKKPFRPTELISSVREVLGAPELAPSL